MINLDVPNVTIPKKLKFLFEPHRYKVLKGGRGSSKSWSVARALLVLGSKKPLRVLCTREIQNSIKQSVHQLLKDQIQVLGLESHYTVYETSIKGANGTEFAFTGLSDLTADTIKSFEGFDICLVEEGQVISRRSWKILIPTIRKEGSEIWIVYNPDLETDETHQRFAVHPPNDCIVVEMNWRDNPWFNDILEAERLHCLETDPDSYDNIWEGKCRPAVEGAIYHRQIQEAEAAGRICNIPHDPLLLVHPVLDLGWDDSLAVGLVQRHTSEVRVIEYLEFSHTTLADLSVELRRRPYNWGRIWIPHDGYAGNLNSGGKTTFDILKGLKWDVATRDEIKEMSIEDGIRHTRLMFPRMYFDAGKTNAAQAPKGDGQVQHTPLSWRLIECIKRYRRRVNRQTETTSTPLKDVHAHGCLRGDTLVRTGEGEVKIEDIRIGDKVWTPRGMSRVTAAEPTKIVSKLLEVVLSDGRTVRCTPEHKFLTTRGFTYADRLRYTDPIFSGEELPCRLISLFSTVTSLGYRETITANQVGIKKDRVTYTGRYGNFITALSQRATKFTTRTKMALTTRLTIWKNGCLDKEQWDSLRTSLFLLDQGPQSGINQKLDANGIPKTQKNYGNPSRCMNAHVKSAVNALCRLFLRVLSFATPTVKQLRYVEEGGGGTLVYDLTVENHACYQANGMLVSNSDCLRYIAINADSMEATGRIAAPSKPWRKNRGTWRSA